jgi:hypothetical protein
VDAREEQEDAYPGEKMFVPHFQPFEWIFTNGGSNFSVRLLSLLGHGSTGIVYKVVDQDMGSRIALKTCFLSETRKLQSMKYEYHISKRIKALGLENDGYANISRASMLRNRLLIFLSFLGSPSAPRQ